MKTRVISGAVLAVVMSALLFYGSWPLFAACMIISVIGLFELYRVAGLQKSVPGILGYIAVIIYYICVGTGLEQYEICVFIVALMAVMAVYVIGFPKYHSNQIMLAYFGIFYVAVMLSYIYKVRLLEDGVYIVWLVFVSSWVNDTFAYFTGVCVGKHKMAPRLSPKKSIEGLIGGVASATAVGFIYGYIVSSRMSEFLLHPVIIFGIASGIGALLSIVGDLAASAIKRNYEIKDYGNIIPGHGGILDRFDSVIFTAPVVYWAVIIINSIIEMVGGAL